MLISKLRIQSCLPCLPCLRCLPYLGYIIAVLLLGACSSQSSQSGLPNNGDASTPDTTTNTTIPGTNSTDSYGYLNNLRNSAGMISLNKNEVLTKSAANHAQYLVTNKVFGHDEVVGRTGYSGTKAGQRAVAAGYNTYSVGEGISSAESEQAALDDLFSAIYHRFTLLSFEFDEIGMSLVKKDVKKDNGNDIFVHNMGNSRIDSLCQTSSSVSVGRFYVDVCERDLKLKADDYEAANVYNQNKNPDYVLWPPENGTDISPVFFEETPDPLPDYSVSGYPVSIQFNEQKTGAIIIADFRLLNLVTQQYVSSTRILNVATDPNSSFSSREFALFPLERLLWATKYRVELEYSEAGTNKALNWEFSTRKLGGVVKQLAVTDTSVSIQSGVKTYLYFTPADGADLISNISSSFPQGTVFNANFVDQNTLEVLINSGVGNKINLLLNKMREISITIT